MTRILRVRSHVARQPHYCYDCDRTIRPGQRYYAVAAIDATGAFRYGANHVHPDDRRELTCDEVVGR